MLWNDRSALIGSHAFLSASNPHWVNYSEDKLVSTFVTSQAARRGTELHELAHQLIRLGERLPRSNRTLNLYVNDAIKYRMRSEQILFYSINCYGCADAISFYKDVLRISDLKTGVSRTSMVQLEIYAALFCLEYKKRPEDLTIELRIYKSDAVEEHFPEPDRINEIMQKIKRFDVLINQNKERDD